MAKVRGLREGHLCPGKGLQPQVLHRTPKKAPQSLPPMSETHTEPGAAGTAGAWSAGTCVCVCVADRCHSPFLS